LRTFGESFGRPATTGNPVLIPAPVKLDVGHVYLAPHAYPGRRFVFIIYPGFAASLQTAHGPHSSHDVGQ
jgi:hypothetical protein